MRRLLALLLAAAALLAAPPAPASAQDPGTSRGPGALWDAYPLEDGRSGARPAGDPAAAPSPPSVRAVPAGAWRDAPGGAPTLALITAGCVALGVAFAAAGLLLAGGRVGVPGVRRSGRGNAGPRIGAARRPPS